MTTRAAFDSSVILTWVLQEQTWQRVHALLSNPNLEPVLPGPVLTEVVHRARARGNTSSATQLWATLHIFGAIVEPPTQEDLLRAAGLQEASDGSPGPRGETLSLGDALVLAVVERLKVPVVTKDRYWRLFADDGHTGATILDY